MSATRYSDRDIPSISLANYDQRIDDITAQLVDAAENVGFFSIVDHGIARSDVDKVFESSSSFFSLPDDVKSLVPFSPTENVGWEKNAQIRPSTGVCDRKESYQLQFNSGMDTRWLPETTVPGFRSTVTSFMRQAQAVSEKLMVCFARGLGFPDDFFVAAHDITKEDSQTVARLLHYFAAPEASNDGQVYHRAGAHTDWDFITLLFQKAGQSGLEICPGREATSTFGQGDVWTRVEPAAESNAIILQYWRPAHVLVRRPLQVYAAPRQGSLRARRLLWGEVQHRLLQSAAQVGADSGPKEKISAGDGRRVYAQGDGTELQGCLASKRKVGGGGYGLK
ncbi:hypothetical protein LLEC1_02933 [Akanthomyces lecanii]|uniref:Non-haem dioxygenase N-terminal domain-containing protein n=1 Tax=Cordyceps confragosa TaxID=2714763 RepID=A0A179ICV2_CORDF|nr:hypothetical protein LLEC1_02933 [Akanthomyces lecanii]